MIVLSIPKYILNSTLSLSLSYWSLSLTFHSIADCNGVIDVLPKHKAVEILKWGQYLNSIARIRKHMVQFHKGRSRFNPIFLDMLSKPRVNFSHHEEKRYLVNIGKVCREAFCRRENCGLKRRVIFVKLFYFVGLAVIYDDSYSRSASKFVLHLLGVIIIYPEHFGDLEIVTKDRFRLAEHFPQILVRSPMVKVYNSTLIKPLCLKLHIIEGSKFVTQAQHTDA